MNQCTETTIQGLARLLGSDAVDMTYLPDGTAVLLDIEGHQAITLSKTSAVIVRAITDGILDATDLATAVTDHFDTDASTAERDLKEFVDQLANALSHG